MSYETEAEFRLMEHSVEMGLTSRITLEQLITSHRNLRKDNVVFHKQLREDIVEARQEAYTKAYKDKTEQGFIAVDDLRNMTIGELLNLIG